jgi:hypothetical protein
VELLTIGAFARASRLSPKAAAYARATDQARAGGRMRTRATSLVGAPQPAKRLMVKLRRLGQGDAHRRGAEVPRDLQAVAGFQVLSPRGIQPQPKIHAVLGPRLDHGERPAGRDQGDQGPAGLDRDLSESGDGGQHRVQDGPQMRAVGILATDELFRLG